MELEPADGTVLAFDRTLDAGAVARARELLGRVPQGTTVVLDFARVRDVDAFALSKLAASIVAQPVGRVLLRSLCRQHARLLRYLGLDPDRLCLPAPAPDEDEREIRATAELPIARAPAADARRA